jgi:hypothetical protein
MTPPKENQREPEPDKRLESILKTVRSIDHNVESILEKLNEYFDDTALEPAWAKDYDMYLNGNDY